MADRMTARSGSAGELLVKLTKRLLIAGLAPEDEEAQPQTFRPCRALVRHTWFPNASGVSCLVTRAARIWFKSGPIARIGSGQSIRVQA